MALHHITKEEVAQLEKEKKRKERAKQSRKRAFIQKWVSLFGKDFPLGLAERQAELLWKTFSKTNHSHPTLEDSRFHILR
ncbi:MAG: hypothetical protein A3D37_00300 [Candidatus Zambryskibacteria bacterium RIFCSPHIGHO2_02_FULL_38_22]|uniref:Uncharacterized protein n=1 Tax=Candidatus Zambryskibacteria bacterium RIFCSPLOWO2_12_FULL_39_16 TaxID=1802775 RepID=A0A1G2URK6_9BACT|nr:MAG: hypothetical protein A3D37_00300 [Candidatus Zambryskibacteria bacterium RIFCSPHIGHO2_02_FULL_38_22]OHB07858.1 MAG: hypothetical protein A3I19_02895 [Candidatus Zambryskibacteria bacterium RIFCSPLOWO2_02_FULL_38_13]OHB11952.1 MAG: hypothetical protein A3G46_01835 [Candidatus Zambryskibacteria bacterium RIFCSPLOWO2_12_FULL_39_16]